MTERRRIILAKDFSKDKKQITLRIDPELYTRMKIHLATQGVTSQEWINRVIFQAIEKEKLA